MAKITIEDSELAAVVQEVISDHFKYEECGGFVKSEALYVAQAVVARATGRCAAQDEIA